MRSSCASTCPCVAPPPSAFPDLLHPFSIDIFEDYIYGVTYINNIVFRVNKFGKGPMENLTTGINHATDIVLYHRYKQPECEFRRGAEPPPPARHSDGPVRENFP